MKIDHIDAIHLLFEYPNRNGFRYSGGVTQTTSWPALGPGDNILSFGEDAAGELYICTESGNVYRIVPAPVPQTRATLADDPPRYRGTSRRGLGSR